MLSLVAAEAPPSEASLWSFACAVYAQPNVAEACLALQDRQQADVNLLLFAAWMATERGVMLTPAVVVRAHELVRQWRQEVVRPLRQARSQLKLPQALVSDAEREALRQDAKTLELRAEKLQLTGLQAQFNDVLPDEAEPAGDLVGLNLRHVLLAPEPLDQAALHCLEIIAAAVRQRRA